MDIEKHLGKITASSFGIDDDGRFGLQLHFAFGGDADRGGHYGADAFIGLDDYERTPPSGKRRTSSNTKSFDLRASDAVQEIGTLLLKSRRRSVEKLVGTPVEVTAQGNTMTSWRVLTEVL